MTLLFSAIVCLSLVVFQTTVMADLPVIRGFYDISVTFVVYLGLYRSARESLPVIAALGLAMDSLSAAPFGLYLTGYMWVFAGIKWLMRYLQMRTSGLILFVVPLAVAIEALFSLAALAFQVRGNLDMEPNLGPVGEQLIWALFTGPLFLLFYEYVHGRIERWAEARKVERNGF